MLADLASSRASATAFPGANATPFTLVGASATMSLALPAFGGITRHHQIFALGIGATGSMVTATASNSLALTLGLF